MTPFNASLAISAITSKVLAPGAPRCRGWDATDPAGCWMPKVRDYLHGFRLFDVYKDAMAYATSLKSPTLLGFDTVAQRWYVEPMSGDYGC